MKKFFIDKKFPLYLHYLLTGFLSLISQKKQMFSIPFCRPTQISFKNNSFLPSEITLMAEVHVFPITCNKLDVFKIILALDVNKAHHHDNFSLRRIKLCTNDVALYLRRYFKITSD